MGQQAAEGVQMIISSEQSLGMLVSSLHLHVGRRSQVLQKRKTE